MAMGYKALKNTNNQSNLTHARHCQSTKSSRSHTKSPHNHQSNAIVNRKCSQQTRSTHSFSYKFFCKTEIIRWTIVLLVIMISIGRIEVNCTMLDTRVSVNSNFEVNEWIEDDLVGDSDNQFVEKDADNIDMDRLQNIIIQGLNLTKMPDVSKVRIFFFNLHNSLL